MWFFLFFFSFTVYVQYSCAPFFWVFHSFSNIMDFSSRALILG